MDIKKRMKLVTYIILSTLIISSCQKKETIIKNTEVEENKENSENQDTYLLKDLYLLCSPEKKDGNVNYEIFIQDKTRYKCGENYLFFQSVLDSKKDYWENEKNLITCDNECWLPDWRLKTLSKAINHPYISNKYTENTKLNLQDIKDLTNILNSNQISFYDKNEEYNINKLILIEINGFYTLYTTEKNLTFSITVDDISYPLIYCFDVNDYHNALQVTLNIQPEEFEGLIHFGTNILKTEITSLDALYAYSLKDEDMNIFTGNLLKENIDLNDENAQNFYKFLTPSQINK